MDLIFNETTQMWEKKKEPFAVIEAETEENFNRLRELWEADQDGRCVVFPKGYNGELFRVWKNQILSTEKFAWIMKKLGKSFFPTFEAAEATLEAARESQE